MQSKQFPIKILSRVQKNQDFLWKDFFFISKDDCKAASVKLVLKLDVFSL